MMQVLELQLEIKGTSWDEMMSSTAKIKPIAVAVIKLCLSEDTSKSASRSVGQSVSQSVRKFDFLRFCSNFLKWIRIDLKTFFGSAIPNQY